MTKPSTEHQIVGMHDVDFDKYPGFCYNKENNLKAVVGALLKFSISLYEESYKLKNWDKFSDLADKIWAEKESVADSELKPFMVEQMIDLVRIIIAFENITKAVLLGGGFLMHIIDKELFPDLHASQKKEPIPLQVICNQSNYFLSDGMVNFKGLTSQTLKNQTLFYKPKYIKVIGFPDDVLEILRTVNKERNQLHLIIKSEMVFSQEFKRYGILNPQINHMKSVMDSLDNDNELSIFHAK